MTHPWLLVADIGGTHARFALGDGVSPEPREPLTLSVAQYPTFATALQTYIEHVQSTEQWNPLPANSCLAVASPVDRDVIRFTNSHWHIDRREVAAALELPDLQVINDFAAVAYAAAGFGESDWEQIGGGTALPHRPVGVLGAGTGLGVCAVIPIAGHVTVIAGEGGHVDYAPVGDEEIEILKRLLQRYERVSAERLLSGVGLQNIYWALTEIHGTEHRYAAATEISSAALAAEDSLAVASLATFCRILGSVAGNLALIYGARGGIYVAGGIAPQVLAFLKTSDFRERFLAKGRFREYLDEIPTRVVTREYPGLVGALQFLMSKTL